MNDKAKLLEHAVAITLGISFAVAVILTVELWSTMFPSEFTVLITKASVGFVVVGFVKPAVISNFNTVGAVITPVKALVIFKILVVKS